MHNECRTNYVPFIYQVIEDKLTPRVPVLSPRAERTLRREASTASVDRVEQSHCYQGSNWRATNAELQRYTTATLRNWQGAQFTSMAGALVVAVRNIGSSYLIVLWGTQKACVSAGVSMIGTIVLALARA